LSTISRVKVSIPYSNFLSIRYSRYNSTFCFFISAKTLYGMKGRSVASIILHGATIGKSADDGKDTTTRYPQIVQLAF